MDEVVAADSGEIAVTRKDDHLELRPTELEAGGEGYGAPVSRVERVQVHIAGHSSRTADSRNDGRLVEVDVGLVESGGEALDDGADTAGGTPDVGHSIHPQEGSDRMLFGNGVLRFRTHRAASTIALQMSAGSCTPPPPCGTRIAGAWPAAQRSTSSTICP